ncbi:SurA N-terminal domain-containing protein [bacterium]|nr:SurA N-terminal domain-containing protein [bacterium]
MMIFMRTHMKTFMWVIICLVVPSFIAVFGYQGIQQRQAERPAFTVDDVPFTAQDWSNQIQNLRNQLQQQMGENFDPDAMDDKRLQKQAFDSLVNQAVIDRTIKELGLVTTDAEVSAEIQRTHTNPQTGRFDRNLYLRELYRRGYPPEMYENQFRHQLTMLKLQELLTQAAQVTEEELDEAYSDFSEQMRVGYLEFPVADYISEVTAGESELREYYEAHKEQFTRLPQVQIGYVPFNAFTFAGQVTAGTDELRTYYEQHATEYLLPARARAEYIRFDAARFRDSVALAVGDATEPVEQFYQERPDRFRSPEKRVIRYVHANLDEEMKKIHPSPEEIREYYAAQREVFVATPEEISVRHILIMSHADEDSDSDRRARERCHMVLGEITSGTRTFEEAARQYSEDRSNAEKGGDLGVVRKGLGMMDPDFEAAAFAAAVGEVTGPVRSRFGYHLIRVDSHRDEVIRPLAEVEGEIVERIAREAARTALRARLEELRGRLADETLDPATLGSTWKVSQPPAFARAARQIDSTIGDDVFIVSRAAFNLTLPAGKLSSVLEGGRNFYLVELVDVQEARQLSLQEAWEDVRRALVEARAGRLAREEAYAALDRIRTSTEGWAAARVQHATWLATTRSFGKDDYLMEFGAAGEKFKNAVLESPQGQVGGPVEGDDASFIFYTLEKSEERIPPFEEVIDRVREAYRQVKRGEVARDAAIDLFNETVRVAGRPGRLKEVVQQFVERKGYSISYEESEPFRREEPIDPAPEFARELKTLREPGDCGYAVVHETAPPRRPGEEDREERPIVRVIVMELQRTFPKRIPEFEEVRDDVEKVVLAERAAPLARAAADQALAEIQAYLASGKGRNASGEIDLSDYTRERGRRLILTLPFRAGGTRRTGTFPPLSTAPPPSWTPPNGPAWFPSRNWCSRSGSRTNRKAWARPPIGRRGPTVSSLCTRAAASPPPLPSGRSRGRSCASSS